MSNSALASLPDELLLRVLSYLDVPELLAVSRTSHRLRPLCLDPQLHRYRLYSAGLRMGALLPRRPPLLALQPPAASIYVSHTQMTARRLHWSLVAIRINRSLARRPARTALVAANILPRECCFGLTGFIIERKRRVEREQVKEGLRVWLERKARAIRARKEGKVKILAWRFSRRDKSSKDLTTNVESFIRAGPQRDAVAELRRFFEALGNREH